MKQKQRHVQGDKVRWKSKPRRITKLVRLPVDAYKNVKSESINQGTTMSKLLDFIVSRYFKEKKSGKRSPRLDELKLL